MENGSVVLTGCGSGIGYSTACRLAADGWNVVGIDIDGSGLSKLKRALGDSHKFVKGDAASREVLAAARLEAENIAPLKGWVNNVGLALMGNLHEPVEKEVERIIKVNLMSYYWGASEAIRTWVKNKTVGAIVNMSSVHGTAAFPMWAAYDVAKGGIDALTRYIAVEYGPIGIRANGIAPGTIQTPLVDQVINASPDKAIAEREMSIIQPMERMGQPEEVAAAVSWLLSSEASFVTGETLAVDGGIAARSYRFNPDKKLLKRYGKKPL